MDAIVFNNNELNSAVSAGAVSIALCDNTFVIPMQPGVHYYAIGNVSASIGMAKKDANENMIVFHDFLPEFSDVPAYANVMHGIHPRTPVNTSFAASFSTSFAASFSTSFAASFSMLFAASFSTSFAASFSTSFGTSFATSFRTSFAQLHLREKYIVKEISVNGYGLNLI